MPKVVYSPAEWVIEQFGGIRKTARRLKVTPPAIMYWKNGREGLIPSKFHVPILMLARKLEVDVKVNDLIYGRTVDDVN